MGVGEHRRILEGVPWRGLRRCSMRIICAENGPLAGRLTMLPGEVAFFFPFEQRTIVEDILLGIMEVVDDEEKEKVWNIYNRLRITHDDEELN